MRTHSWIQMIQCTCRMAYSQLDTNDTIAKMIREEIVVVAIDIGTAFSGYAYSYKYDFEKNPLQIYTPTWPYFQTLAYKTSTVLMLHEDRETMFFGSEAEEKMSFDNIEDEQDREKEMSKWYYFKTFKMDLYEQVLF